MLIEQRFGTFVLVILNRQQGFGGGTLDPVGASSATLDNPPLFAYHTPMTRRNLLTLLRAALFALVTVSTIAFLISGCGYPKHIDPPVLTYPTSNMAWLSALARAKDIGGTVYNVADTHSMEPYLQGGDYVVIDPRVAFADVPVGIPIGYKAEWQPAGGSPVLHRVIGRDASLGGGLLVEGDNVKPLIDSNGQDLHRESSFRVKASQYLGVLDGVYRVKP